MSFNGKKIVVTGGSGGIGALLCEALVKQRAEVWVLDRTAGTSQRQIASDLSRPEGIAEAAAKMREIAPDILVNLAGMQFFGAFETETSEHLQSLMQVNLIAPMQLAQAVIPGMRQKGGGMIVNIGSVFGSIPSAYFAAYSTSKAGMRALSDALRREMEDSGIRVVHIAPRAVKTALNNAHVLAFANAIHMKMDTPETVVARILSAMQSGTAHTVIGFPERLFVKLHGLSYALIDKGIRSQTKAAQKILASHPQR